MTSHLHLHLGIANITNIDLSYFTWEDLQNHGFKPKKVLKKEYSYKVDKSYEIFIVAKTSFRIGDQDDYKYRDQKISGNV